MALVHVRVFGRSMDDRFVFKLILGVTCTVILLAVVGQQAFGDWVVRSLVIWIAVTMIVVPLTYAFVEEGFTVGQLAVLIIGLVIIILFVFITQTSIDVLAVSVLQSLVWMSIFALILDTFRKRIDR
jgi:hypothetical protein